MTKIVIYTDFDGTVSSREGSKTVFSDFYNSLLTEPNLGYKASPLKDKDVVQQLFVEKFGEFNDSFNYEQDDADILISAQAVKFFHDVLKSDDVVVNIVTKNRADYIKALLHYQGFSTEEIAKITFMDTGVKYTEVKGNLLCMTERADLIYIMDDSPSDYGYMCRAAREQGYSAQLRSHHEPVGKFPWLNYLEEINMALSAPKMQEENVIIDFDEIDEEIVEEVMEERVAVVTQDGLRLEASSVRQLSIFRSSATIVDSHLESEIEKTLTNQ